MRMWIDIRISERPIAIPKLGRQMIEPLETRVATVLMPKGHGQHPRHDHLHTIKTLYGMLWRSLIHHYDVDATLRIMLNQCGEIIS